MASQRFQMGLNWLFRGGANVDVRHHTATYVDVWWYDNMILQSYDSVLVRRREKVQSVLLSNLWLGQD